MPGSTLARRQGSILVATPHIFSVQLQARWTMPLSTSILDAASTRLDQASISLCQGSGSSSFHLQCMTIMSSLVSVCAVKSKVCTYSTLQVQQGLSWWHWATVSRPTNSQFHALPIFQLCAGWSLTFSQSMDGTEWRFDRGFISRSGSIHCMPKLD